MLYISCARFFFFPTGKYASATQDCDKAIAQDATWERSYTRKAQALAKLQRFSAAVEVLRKGLVACKPTCKMIEKMLEEMKMKKVMQLHNMDCHYVL